MNTLALNDEWLDRFDEVFTESKYPTLVGMLPESEYPSSQTAQEFLDRADQMMHIIEAELQRIM